MKCVRENRTLILTEIPDYREANSYFSSPARMVITLAYEGPSNVVHAIALDNTIIPAIVKALNTTPEEP